MTVAARLVALLRDRAEGPEDRVALGAFTVFSRWQRAGLLLAVAVLMALRLPRTWAHGRLLDEEGTIFLAFAWHRSAGEALWRSFGGYLNLAANATTLGTARLVQIGVLPLEFAPYLTMVTALLFQLVPALLILTGSARWLANRWAVGAALLFLATAPATEEVFFNVLHIQFHLALCVALILALDAPRSRAARAAHAVILFIAPLCGPGAIAVAPFFALRAAIDRDATRAGQFAVIAGGVAIQLIVFFLPSPARGHLPDPTMLAATMFVRLAALPLLGWSTADSLGGLLHASRFAGGAGWGWWWFGVLGALAYFGLLIGLAWRHRRDAAIWLIGPGLALAVISFGGGSISMGAREWFSVGAGERYNFLPLVLISLGLIALARSPDGQHRRLCTGLCLLTLISGAISFGNPIGELADGPDWRDQTALWHRDHDHHLTAWPASWTVDLSDRDAPCPPVNSDRAASFAPTYCESAWLARVMRSPGANDASR